MTQDTQSTNSDNLVISDSARDRIILLSKKQNSKGEMLRIAVDGGGCSGFQYKFSFENTQNDDDILITNGEAKVLIDEVSMDFLKSSQLDFVSELGGSFFAINNPNATASCGCGNSFSV